jgi:hypothetical protein
VIDRRNIPTIVRERLGHGCADPIRDTNGFGIVRETLADHDEIVATDPCEGVLGPSQISEPSRDRAQQLVAGSEAEIVVDGLETVDVEKDHAEDHRCAGKAMHGLCQSIDEEPPIRETGELIVELPVEQRRARRLLFGDVQRGTEHARGSAVGGDLDPTARPQPSLEAAGDRDAQLDRERGVLVDREGQRVDRRFPVVGVDPFGQLDGVGRLIRTVGRARATIA